ncbi:MAG: hypothetical protein JSW45_12745 [Thiotrichales bacterium]|nr:MAG: hypothetical protein JSW45_12745 [Thiotrichales bacterium]
MQLSYNSVASDQTVSLGTADAGVLTISEAVPASGALTANQTQPASTPDIDWGDFTMVFFAAGVVINLVMLTAYFVWACKQWGKEKARDE